MLLTDEEITKILTTGVYSDSNQCDGPLILHKSPYEAIAKAQFKKVVDYLLNSGSGDIEAWFMYTDEGQALLKEVE